jgi:hypothetical protein
MESEAKRAVLIIIAIMITINIHDKILPVYHSDIKPMNLPTSQKLMKPTYEPDPSALDQVAEKY